MRCCLSFVKLCLVIMGTTVFYSSSIANDSSERLFYLGVLNGSIKDAGFVVAKRTIPEPLAYKINIYDEVPESIIVRNAFAKKISQNKISLTVRQDLGSNQEAFITLVLWLIIDGKHAPINFNQIGEDVFIKVSSAKKTIELKSNDLIELQVPVNYKGNIQVEMQLETY